MKMKEAAVSQGMEVVEVVSRSWKSQENSSSPRASRRNLALENSMDRRVWQPTSPGTDEKTKAQRGKGMLRVMQLVKSEVEFLIWV